MAQSLSAKREMFSVDSEARMKSQAKLSESNENMFARLGSFPRFSLVELTISRPVIGQI